MHITNTSIIPLITKSVPSSDKYLLLTRPFYQSPIFEIGLVLGPIVAHVASGIGLRFYRRNQNIKWYGAESKEDRQKVSWPKLSATSILGYTLWPIAFLHVVVNRYVPLFVDGGSSGVGLGYVAHGCAKYSKVMSIFYGSLVLVGVSHFVRGWAKWLNLEPNQTTGGGDAVDKGLRKKRRWYIMNGLAVGITALWMVGGGVVAGGGASTGWIGEGFDKLYRSVPIIGNWY